MEPPTIAPQERHTAHPTRYKGEAIARAVRALAVLAGEPGLGLASLAARTGVPKATLAGILNTLVAHDWLLLDSSKGYRLGYAWLRFAEARRGQSGIRDRALPIMRRIRDALDETVILSLKVGDRRVHLDYIESTQSVRRIAQPGQEAPLHVGAAGLVLLAGFDEAGIEAYLARTKGAAVDAAAVRSAVAKVKRDGYAVAAGTVNADTAAVAAPVRAYSGEIVASLAVSCPRDRFTEGLRKACIAAVTEGARTLSRALGFAA